MSFFIAPFLSEIGIGISTVLAAEGVSSGIAYTVGGLAVGELSKQIDGTLEAAINSIVGKESVDKAKADASGILTQGFNAADAVLTGNTSAFTIKIKNSAYQDHINGVVDTSQGIAVPPPRLPSYSPKELSDLLVKHTTMLSYSDLSNPSVISDVGLAVSDSKVESLTLLQKLNTFAASKVIPKNDLFDSIYTVYTGKVITDKTVLMSFDQEKKLIRFDWNDEVNDTHTLFQNTGLVVPSVYGTFGGINSINNAYPKDLLDTFFCFHDQSYTGNIFSLKGDYQLISRLTQNMNRFSPEAQAFAKTTIIYFSTIGHVLASIKGSLPDSITKQVVPNLTKDDIFPVVQPEAQSLPNADYIIARFNFYKELESSFIESSKQHGIYAPSGVSSQLRLAQEFGNIMITEL